jgi:hypothetical protein
MPRSIPKPIAKKRKHAAALMASELQKLNGATARHWPSATPAMASPSWRRSWPI